MTYCGFAFWTCCDCGPQLLAANNACNWIRTSSRPTDWSSSSLSLSSSSYQTSWVQQESLANAKGNARERCMFEGPLQTKSKLTDPSNWHWVWWIHIRQMALPSGVAAAVWLAECEYFEGVPKFDAPVRRISWTQGAKFKLVKTTFNAESFIRRLSRSISSDFGTVRSWSVCRSPKSPKNPLKPHILVFKVTQGHCFLSKASVGLPISD